MILINTVIGHEKNRQEALGQFSSVNKQQIWQVRDTFRGNRTTNEFKNVIANETIKK